MKKLILKNYQSPGDIVMLTACLRDLHIAYPEQYITDIRTSATELWFYNPFLTPLDEQDPDVETIEMEYPLIHTSNEGAHHFIHAFHQFLEKKLNIRIPVTKLKGDVYVSKEESSWFSQIYEILNKDVPYWIIDAGTKNDYTAKQWDIERYQQIVDAFPNTYFVQIGAKEHNHTALTGNNLINLIGKTDTRQFVRLMYHAFGVITPVSFPMHLAAAVDMHPRYKRKTRPCVVIAGGREPSVWEAYTNHAYIHTCGMLSCSDNGGCWKSRTIPIGDGDSKDQNTCIQPIQLTNGKYIPKCLDMISAEEVIQKVRYYIGQ